MKDRGNEDLEQLFKETKHLKPRLHLTAEEMDELIEGMFK